MPGLDNHLCFALYAAGNHMTRIFVPFLKKLGVTYPQYHREGGNPFLHTHHDWPYQVLKE
jgi:hypothetical protein